MGFGHPLLDICLTVLPSMLEKYKVERGSVQLAEPHHLPIYEELCKSDGVGYVAGGATMNSIRVISWMLDTHDDDTVAYSGCIGTDSYGDILRKELQKSHIKGILQTSDKAPTGTCAVLVNKKERTLITNLGAAQLFAYEPLETPIVKKQIEMCDIFYFAGYFLNIKSLPQTHLHIAQHCMDNNKVLCMNISAPFLCDLFKKEISTLFPYVDYLFGNSDEAVAFAEKQGWPTEDLADIVARCVQCPKMNTKRSRIVVITCGERPTLVGSSEGVTGFPVADIEDHLVVDTNACGDAFVGGFLSQLAYNGTLTECVNAGHYAAWEIIQQMGCTLPSHLPRISLYSKESKPNTDITSPRKSPRQTILPKSKAKPKPPIINTLSSPRPLLTSQLSPSPRTRTSKPKSTIQNTLSPRTNISPRPSSTRPISYLNIPSPRVPKPKPQPKLGAIGTSISPRKLDSPRTKKNGMEPKREAKPRALI